MSYFAAEVEAQEVCIIDMGVAFPSRSEAPDGDFASVFETRVGEEDLGVRLSEDLEVDVQILSVAVAPLTNVDDLSFIDRMSVSVGADGSVIPPTLVVDMTADHLSGGALYGEPAEKVDVTAHIRAGELVMDFEIAGSLPETDWEANVDLCMSTRAKYVAPL